MAETEKKKPQDERQQKIKNRMREESEGLNTLASQMTGREPYGGKLGRAKPATTSPGGSLKDFIRDVEQGWTRLLGKKDETQPRVKITQIEK